MSAPDHLRLVLLTELIDRAAALARGRTEAAVLAEALVVGTTRLERAGGEKLFSVQPTNGLPRGAAALDEQLAARASYDLLRQRALALTEQHEALDRAVGELARESLELQDQLWALHTRAGTLKVALGLATNVRERPEAAPTIGSGGGGRRRRGMLERLLGGLERREVELALPSDELERATALIRARGWDGQWGDDAPLLVLAYGLAVLEQDQPAAGSVPSAAAPPSTEALRFRLFELADAIRVLEIRQTAFRIDNQGMRLRLAQLQQEVAELESALGEQGGPPTERPNRGLLDRLFRRPRPAPPGPS
jgi:hypothetical protein